MPDHEHECTFCHVSRTLLSSDPCALGATRSDCVCGASMRQSETAVHLLREHQVLSGNFRQKKGVVWLMRCAGSPECAPFGLWHTASNHHQDFTVRFDYLPLVLHFPCCMSYCLSHLVKCSQVTRTWTWLRLAWQVVTKEARKAVQGLPTQSDLPCPSNLSILQIHYLVWGTIHKMFTYFLSRFTHWYKTWKKLFAEICTDSENFTPCCEKFSFHEFFFHSCRLAMTN